MTTYKNRLIWPDLIRIIAVFLVIMVHSSSKIVTSWLNASPSDWMIANIYDSISRVSVPLFVMLSGALLLNRKEDLFVFLKKRIKRIFLPWLFWGTVLLVFTKYIGFSNIFETMKYDFSNIKLVITENFIGGFWFMPMLVGIYLTTPIIKKFLIKSTDTEIKYFFAIWLTISSIIPFANKMFDLSISFINPSWFLYLGYYIGGYYLVYKIKDFKKSITKLKVLFLVSFLITVLGTYQQSLMNDIFTNTFYDYLSISVVAMSFTLFSILFYYFRNIKLNKKISSIIYHFSQNSFGILLCHTMILEFFSAGNYPIISIPISVILTFLVSNSIIGILKGIKIVKNLVG
ncbi:acyltransferase family protein [Candidatus Woesebacteria bacterium]|nr:acyltransferase family protein [Candidatus Woesebacteria bacterium]